MSERVPIITLTTDLGTRDHYVGAMKAVMLGVSTELAIVDITHEIPPHDLMEAGWVLRNAFATFPPRSVHVAVVDPGVGTTRRPIVAVAGEHLFVGPDNGVFSFVFDVCPPRQVIEISTTHYLQSEISATFHGRDIFAPAAAHLAKGADPSHFGDTIDDFSRLELPRPKVTPGGSVRVAVAHVDRFGNVILNVTHAALAALMERVQATGVTASIGDRRIQRLVKTYGDASPGEPVLLYNSGGFLEIAVNQGRAADLLKLRAGDAADLTLATP